jgi:hypothetical protein
LAHLENELADFFGWNAIKYVHHMFQGRDFALRHVMPRRRWHCNWHSQQWDDLESEMAGLGQM